MPKRGAYLLQNIEDDIAEAIASLNRNDIESLRLALATLAVEVQALRTSCATLSCVTRPRKLSLPRSASPSAFP